MDMIRERIPRGCIVVGCMTFTPLLCCLLLIAPPQIADALCEREAGRAEDVINEAAPQIAAITDDMLLSETGPTTERIESSTSRIRGNAVYSFGTARPYEAVLADYVAWFAERDWQREDNSFVIPNATATRFDQNGDLTQTVFIYQNPPQTSEFATSYTVEIRLFGDPASCRW